MRNGVLDSIHGRVALNGGKLALKAWNIHEFAERKIQMILHGIEDVNVELGLGFIADYAVLLNAFSEIGGIPYLDKATATTMKISS